MEFDLITIACVLLAGAIGALIYYAAYTRKINLVDTVYDKMSSLYNTYGEDLKAKDPDLSLEVEMALKAMNDALADDKISALEALDISAKFLGVFNQLSEFVKANKKK